MSINNLKRKAIYLLLVILCFSLISSGVRQLSVNYRTKREITQKEKLLKQLEEKNLALKVRLEEVNSREFLDEEARKLLGVGDASASPQPAIQGETDLAKTDLLSKPPNLQKWLALFGF